MYHQGEGWNEAGGRTSLFGRRSWKKRYVVVQACHMGIYKSKKDFDASRPPIKQRWVRLVDDERRPLFRCERSLHDRLAVLLIPGPDNMDLRVWKFRARDADEKEDWLRAFGAVLGGLGIMNKLKDALMLRKLSQ